MRIISPSSDACLMDKHPTHSQTPHSFPDTTAHHSTYLAASMQPLLGNRVSVTTALSACTLHCTLYNGKMEVDMAIKMKVD